MMSLRGIEMGLKEEIGKLIQINEEVVQTRRITGKVALKKSVICDALRLVIPSIPESQFVEIGVEQGVDRIDEYDHLHISWDKLETIKPVEETKPIEEETARPGTPAFAQQRMAEMAQEPDRTSVMGTDNLQKKDENESRRFRYFYVLDNILGKGDLTYEEARDIVNTGGFLGDFSAAERDAFTNNANICDEFATGNGIIMRVQDAR
jgi:hypothetical protein